MSFYAINKRLPLRQQSYNRNARIEIQTAPLTKVNETYSMRDPEKLGWREIDATDAWRDDKCSAEYVLHCERPDSPPRR